jgi:vacuolar-type H+-ATPase subunit F/Vma7
MSNKTAEISYDLIMDDNMSFVEGCYRLPNQDWQVVIVSKWNAQTIGYKFTEWDSGVTGIVIKIPKHIRLDAERTEKILSKILRIEVWQRVRGPDSIILR